MPNDLPVADSVETHLFKKMREDLQMLILFLLPYLLFFCFIGEIYL